MCVLILTLFALLAFGPCFTVDRGSLQWATFQGDVYLLVCEDVKIEYMFVSVLLWCNMWDEEGWRRNLVLVLVYSYWKAPRGSPGSKSPSNKWATVNSTYTFTTDSLWKNLGFNLVIFWNRHYYPWDRPWDCCLQTSHNSEFLMSKPFVDASTFLKWPFFKFSWF